MSNDSLKAKLDSLVNQRDSLKSILKNKGVSGVDNLTGFDQLVPKVNEIETGTGGINTSDATATVNDIIKNKTAYVNGQKITGQLELWPLYTDVTSIMPGAKTKIFSTEKTRVNSVLTVLGDEHLISDNIKSGVNIFGVDGNSNVVNTGDATATANDIRSGCIAYVAGEKIIGTLENMSNVPMYDYSKTENVTPTLNDYSITPKTNNQRLLTYGKQMPKNIIIQGDSNLIASNIVAGTTIFNVTGTATVDTLSPNCTATEHMIINGKTAVVDRELVTGTLDLSLLPSLTNGNGGVNYAI